MFGSSSSEQDELASLSAEIRRLGTFIEDLRRSNEEILERAEGFRNLVQTSEREGQALARAWAFDLLLRYGNDIEQHWPRGIPQSVARTARAYVDFPIGICNRCSEKAPVHKVDGQFVCAPDWGRCGATGPLQPAGDFSATDAQPYTSLRMVYNTWSIYRERAQKVADMPEATAEQAFDRCMADLKPFVVAEAAKYDDAIKNGVPHADWVKRELTIIAEMMDRSGPPRREYARMRSLLSMFELPDDGMGVEAALGPDDQLLLRWECEKGFGQLLFRGSEINDDDTTTPYGRIICSTETMSREFVLRVLHAWGRTVELAHR